MNETIDERVNDIEINLQELLLVYLRKWWVILLCIILFGTAAFFVTWKFVTPTYQASITIYVNNNRGLEDKTYLSSADLSAAQRLVNTYVSIAKSDRVLAKISEGLDGEYTPEQLSQAITAKQLNETEIFGMYVVNEDPDEAARIANVAAEVAPGEISNLIEGTSARVIDYAKVPKNRFSPSYSRAALLGAVVGASIAVIFLTIHYLIDTHIKDENDLTDMFNLPILGRIPDFEYAASGNSYGYSTGGEDEEENEK